MIPSLTKKPAKNHTTILQSMRYWQNHLGEVRVIGAEAKVDSNPAEKAEDSTVVGQPSVLHKTV